MINPQQQIHPPAAMRPPASWTEASRPRGRTLLYLLIILAGFLVHSRVLCDVEEDAYITFRFARNLVAGHGFVWNPGEGRVEGFTSLLWLLGCSAACRLGLDLPRFSQVCGLVAALGTLACTLGFARQGFRLSARWALFACALLAAAGPMAYWAGSGMETTFFGLCVVAACLCTTRCIRSGSVRDAGLAAFVLLAAALTRPEGVMVFAVLSTLAVVATADRRAVSLRLIGTFGLVFVVPFGLYFAWRYRYFGYLLPNTYYAKTGGTYYQYLRGLVYTSYFTLKFVLPLLWFPILLLWEHAGRIRWQVVRRSILAQALRNAPAPFVCITLGAAYVAYIVYVGGDYMAMYRFFVPIMPLLALLVAQAGDALAARVTTDAVKRGSCGLLGALCLAAVFIQSTPMERYIFQEIRFTHGTYRGVVHSKYQNARMVLLGRFFDSYKRDSADSLLTNAIGAISYFSGMKIYDQNGLQHPEIAHSKPTRRFPGWGMAGHERDGTAFLLARRPTYIMFNRYLWPEPLPWPDAYAPAVQTVLRSSYHLRSVRLVDDVNHETGYFTFLETDERPLAATQPGSTAP